MDNMLFSNMTLNPQPLHIDAHFCATETEWGRPLMNSLFTLGLMIGISVNDTTVGTTIANLGMTDVAFPAPLVRRRHGARGNGGAVGASLEVAAGRGPRRVPPSRLQAGRDARRRMPANGLHAPARAGDRLRLKPMRSLLIAPGDDAAKLAAALASAAHAVVVDLDVAAGAARGGAGECGAGRSPRRRSVPMAPALIVRVSPLESGETDRDLDAIMPAAPFAVMLPRTRGAAERRSSFPRSSRCARR